ncbi:protein LMBR1L-like, partial [Ruditapes philippinarum]|uniref:protein LMBR1L-like n=1 Tax=Ruditapes philippinarum TaxID=129788 RepID=UPI00295BB950
MAEEELEELQKFHDAVREIIISLLLFILLYVSSYSVISWFKKRTDTEEYVTGDDDAFVYRIALWLCTFTLAVSAGAVLLLPISIVSNEVLLLHPHSYYVKWLNSSLIHGLWNYVFLFSNLALFLMMPFAYFFTESEGFSGSRNGIMARIKETTVMLALLAVSVIGVSWVLIALFDSDTHSHDTLSDIWNIYLPYLYSCISFLGVLLLLLCTPVGFACMFTSMTKLVLKPQFLRDINEELTTARFREDSFRRKIRDQQQCKHESRVAGRIANGHSNHKDTENYEEKLEEALRDIHELEKRKQISCMRTLMYPILMLFSIALTVLGVLMVAQNMFQLLVGIKALPVGAKEMVLGITSLSALGWPGSILETILILYLMSASVVGFYSLPLFRRIQPKYHETSMLHIIFNCSVLLILSSALPVLSRT